MLNRLERKEALIRALAKYLTRDLAKRSVLLQMEDPEAKAWAEVWYASGLMGYVDAEEAEKHLRELLG